MTKGLILDDNNTEEMSKIMDTNILALCIGSLISQSFHINLYNLKIYPQSHVKL
jgi:hypothetical protein